MQRGGDTGRRALVSSVFVSSFEISGDRLEAGSGSKDPAAGVM